MSGLSIEFFDDCVAVEGAHHHIGPICVDEPVEMVGIVVRGQQYGVSCTQRREVGDDDLDLVGAGDQYQTTATSKSGRLPVDALVQVAVGDRLVHRYQTRCVTESAQIVR